MDFVKAFNGFRGIAFINVLIDHYTYSQCTLDIGQFGVAMFYVLSSYLLTGQLYKQYLEKNTLNIANYCVRRFFRIYPCLTVALACEYFTSRLTNFQIRSVFTLTGIVGFYWAIYIEMRFYVLVPFIVLLFAHLKNFVLKFTVMLVLTLVGFFYHYYLNFIVDVPRGFRRWDIDDYSFEKNIVFVNYLPIFLIGSFMSIIVYHLKKIKYDFNKLSVAKGFFILFISLIHGPMIYYRCVNGVQTFWNLPFSNFNIIFCSGYVLALKFMHGKNFMTAFYQSKLISFFGDVSYPAYLFHTIVREFTFKYWGWKSTNGFQLFLCFLLTIALAYLLHISVETYCINWTKQWFLARRESRDIQATPGPKGADDAVSREGKGNGKANVDDFYKNVPTNSINNHTNNPYYIMPVESHKNDLEISMGLIEQK